MIYGKAIVKNADMPESMQEEAVSVASHAMDVTEQDKDIASKIKDHFDRKYGRNWHCIVGKQYGSNVTHQEQCFVYFILGVRSVLLFKSG